MISITSNKLLSCRCLRSHVWESLKEKLERRKKKSFLEKNQRNVVSTIKLTPKAAASYMDHPNIYAKNYFFKIQFSNIFRITNFGHGYLRSVEAVDTQKNPDEQNISFTPEKSETKHHLKFSQFFAP